MTTINNINKSDYPRFSVWSDSLYKALGAILKVIPKKPSIPALSYVHIETSGNTVILSATDCEQIVQSRITAKVDKPGSILLPAKTLYDLFSPTLMQGNHRLDFSLWSEKALLTEEMITKGMTLKFSGTRVRLKTPIAVSDYPPIPTGESELIGFINDFKAFKDTVNHIDRFRDIKKNTGYISLKNGQLTLIASSSGQYSKAIIPLADFKEESFELKINIRALRDMLQGLYKQRPQDVSLHIKRNQDNEIVALVLETPRDTAILNVENIELDMPKLKIFHTCEIMNPENIALLLKSRKKDSTVEIQESLYKIEYKQGDEVITETEPGIEFSLQESRDIVTGHVYSANMEESETIIHNHRVKISKTVSMLGTMQSLNLKDEKHAALLYYSFQLLKQNDCIKLTYQQSESAKMWAEFSAKFGANMLFCAFIASHSGEHITTEHKRESGSPKPNYHNILAASKNSFSYEVENKVFGYEFLPGQYQHIRVLKYCVMDGTRRYLHEKSSQISLWDKGQTIRKAQSKILHSGITELWTRIDYQDIDKYWSFYEKLEKQVKRLISHLENKAPTPNFENMLDTDSHEEYSHSWDNLSNCPYWIGQNVKRKSDNKVGRIVWITKDIQDLWHLKVEFNNGDIYYSLCLDFAIIEETPEPPTPNNTPDHEREANNKESLIQADSQYPQIGQICELFDHEGLWKIVEQNRWLYTLAKLDANYIPSKKTIQLEMFDILTEWNTLEEAQVKHPTALYIDIYGDSPSIEPERVPALVMNAEIITPGANFFTQSIEIEAKNKADTLPAHDPSPLQALLSILPNKWYYLKSWKAYRGYNLSIVYVRRVESNRVHYCEIDEARRNPHEAEKTKMLNEFKRSVNDATTIIMKSWDKIPLHADTYPIRHLIEQGDYIERIALAAKPDVIKIESITIDWSESGVRDWPITVSTWDEADHICKAIAQEFSGGGYEKTGYTIRWSDGEEYNGRYDILAEERESASLARWIWRFQSSIAGYYWDIGRDPQTWDQGFYADSIENSKTFLNDYDLNGWNGYTINQEESYQALNAPLVPLPEDKEPEPIPESPYDDRRPATKEEISALDTKSISAKDTAKLIRADLKKSFLGTKFSVRTNRATWSMAIDVYWVDGPKRDAVQFIINKYRSEVSSARPDDSTDTIYWMINGELIRYGARFLSCDRSYSADFTRRIAEKIAAENGIEPPTIEECETDHPYKHLYGKISNDTQINDENLSRLVWMRCHETDAGQQEAPAPTPDKPKENTAEAQNKPLIATQFGNIWEFSGDTKTHKNTIKSAASRAGLRANFDKRRLVWVVPVKIGALLPSSLHKLCTIDAPLVKELLDNSGLMTGSWGDHWRIWGATKPHKATFKAAGFYWNGSQWILDNEDLPQSIRALFGTEPTPPNPDNIPDEKGDKNADNNRDNQSDSFDWGSWASPSLSPKNKAEAQNKTADKLRTIADKLEDKIEGKFRDRQTNTHRRVSMAKSAEADGRNLQKLQNLLYKLAEGHEADNLPELLRKIDSRALLEYITFHSVYPNRIISGRDIYQLMENTESENEEKRLLALLNYRSKNNPQNHYESWIHIEELGTIRTIIRKAGKAYQGKDFSDLTRLVKIGINESNYESTRFALLALLDEGIGEKTPKQKITDIERDLVGVLMPSYFPTPPDLVQIMLNHADIRQGMTILEPSAGAGHIADMIREQYPKNKIQCIEIQSRLRDILELKGYAVDWGDFLEHERQYDRIIMNPPFENFQDIEHVKKAYKLLAAAGRVVAVMSESPFFRNDKKAQDFRAWLKSVGGWSEKLPNGSFKQGARPTGVAVRLVVIDK